MFIKRYDDYLKPNTVFQYLVDKGDFTMFLDSGNNQYPNIARYSFLAINPFQNVFIEDRKIYLDNQYYADDIGHNIIDLLQNLQNKYAVPNQNQYDLPFVGGLIGHISYEFGLRNYNLRASREILGYDLFFGLYNNVIIFDESNQKMYLSDCGINDDFAKIDQWISEINPDLKCEKSQAKQPTQQLKSNFDKSRYIETVKTIQDNIFHGNVYQVNLSQQFNVSYTGDPVVLYNLLSDLNSAPYGAYIDTGKYQILSTSPERFIRLNDDIIITEPIKGTIKKGTTHADQEQNKQSLINSEKDQSEHLMIVDLQRNDLSRICHHDSVEVTELYGLYEFKNLYHLISTIQGKLLDKQKSIQSVFDMLPAGSITGTPKKSAIALIDQLENKSRNIYTGNIGYIGFNGNIDLNVAIRSIMLYNNELIFNSGGAVVWDSDAESEYDETILKSQTIIDSINQI